MMTKLINLSKKNLLCNVLIRLAVLFSTGLIDLWYRFCGYIRTSYKIKSKYVPLLQVKNKYEGKRCFIICTGPSLTVEDLESLTDEYTFGMNSICLLARQTKFRPTFYGCCDLGVYRELKYQMADYCNDCKNVFVSDRLARNDSVPTEWIQFPLNVAYNTYSRWFKNDFWCKFSGDCYRVVYNMHSITHCLIQIAVYMGFKEIYLLGADCSFPKGQKLHFKDYGVIDTTIDTARERNVAGYEEVKKYCDIHGVAIYNVTRGGKLEVFPRKSLEAVLNKA